MLRTVILVATAKILAALSILAITAPIATARIPSGFGEQVVQIGNVQMEVYTYRPNCANPALLLVFHGLNRKPESSLKSAVRIADHMCMVAVAPLFDEQTFPSSLYQRGGIVHQRQVQDPTQWTGNFVLGLVEWAQRQERRAMDYYLIGHSAGGQFLSRVAAFVPTQARRIVIANPSTYVFPSLEVRAPFGFGGVYQGEEAEAQLRRYLEQPITIFLGLEDVGSENLSETPEAMAQGRTRYERGRNMFNAAMRLARARGWRINWRLVEVPGVGHSARRMYRAPQMADALRP